MLETVRKNLFIKKSFTFDGDDPPGNPGRTMSDADMLDRVKKMVDKHSGDAMAVAMQLFGENFDLRSSQRTITDENAKLKKDLGDANKKLESSVILEGDEATIIQLWEKDGLKPTDVAKTMSEQGTRIKEIDRKDLVNSLSIDPEDKDGKKQRFDPAKLELLLDNRDLRKTDKGAIEIKNGDDWVAADKWLTEDRAALLGSLAPQNPGTSQSKLGQFGDNGRQSKAPQQPNVEQTALQKRRSGDYAL